MKSNRFDSDAIAGAIAGARARFRRLGSPLVFHTAIGSTNDAAMAIATEGAVVVADEQTAGRGRRGHTWFSPPGSGLYVSVVLTPRRAGVDPRRATALLTLAAGVALAEGLQSSVSLPVNLKWPNDLYIASRKLGGILAEATRDAVVLGYGINVREAARPPELRDRTTSVESEVGRSVDRLDVLVETLAALARRYDDLLDGRFDAILEAWRSRAPSAHGTLVTWSAPSGAQSGITTGIDGTGALLVRVNDRIERIVGGELTWS